MLAAAATLSVSADGYSPPVAALSILGFGGKADGVFNNQGAIRKAMAACAAAGGCSLTFPLRNVGAGPITRKPLPPTPSRCTGTDAHVCQRVLDDGAWCTPHCPRQRPCQPLITLTPPLPIDCRSV